jgi:hypothetical protein
MISTQKGRSTEHGCCLEICEMVSHVEVRGKSESVRLASSGICYMYGICQPLTRIRSRLPRESRDTASLLIGDSRKEPLRGRAFRDEGLEILEKSLCLT